MCASFVSYLLTYDVILCLTSFWVNGSFNICLNNCLFSNPTGAPDLFKEQVAWLEERLIYGRENNATHIFVYGKVRVSIVLSCESSVINMKTR